MNSFFTMLVYVPMLLCGKRTLRFKSNGKILEQFFYHIGA
jgi:hypothetical protein